MLLCPILLLSNRCCHASHHLLLAVQQLLQPTGAVVVRRRRRRLVNTRRGCRARGAEIRLLRAPGPCVFECKFWRNRPSRRMALRSRTVQRKQGTPAEAASSAATAVTAPPPTRKPRACASGWAVVPPRGRGRKGQQLSNCIGIRRQQPRRRSCCCWRSLHHGRTWGQLPLPRRCSLKEVVRRCIPASAPSPSRRRGRDACRAAGGGEDTAADGRVGPSRSAP